MIFSLLNYLKYSRSSFLKIDKLPFGSLAIVPFLLHTIATIWAIEYLFVPQVHKITENKVTQSLTEVGDRVFSRLDNYLVKSGGNSQKLSRTSIKNLNNFLEQLESEIPELTELTIRDENGSIVARLDSKSDNLASSIPLPSSFSSEAQKRYSQLTARRRTLGHTSSEKNSGNWLITVAIQMPVLTTDAIAEQNKIRLQYLSYLLPTTLIGIAICVWLERSWRNSVIVRTRNHNLLEKELDSKNKSTSSKFLKKELKHERQDNYVQSSLVADMSHELRSPLNAILGFAQIMLQEPIERSQQENLAIINSSGERLLKIINELVDLSKIEVNRLNLEPRSFDFSYWLNNLEKNLKFQNQQLELAVIREPDLPHYIYLDESRLRQIIGNLLDYCLKPKEGSLKLKVWAISTLSEDGASPPQYDLYFEIENSSLMVPTEELAGLFDPSLQSRQQWQSSQSSSLSLAISRKLAQLMGGELVIISDRSGVQGTAFRLKVRTQVATTHDLPVESTPQKIASLESNQPEYRILVVDDSKTNRKIMVYLLEKVGFKVREAVNGREAVDVWLSWQPHMIWMDLRMPIMNGYEATEQIKSRCLSQSPPIIALTASTLEEERSLFSASKYDDFVGKPFSENIIFDKIAQHLGVRYVYETTIQPQGQKIQLTTDNFKIMSQQWLNQVEQAAASLNAVLLTTLLQQIPTEHAGLKQALQKQIDDFDFETILSLIEQIEKEQTK